MIHSPNSLVFENVRKAYETEDGRGIVALDTTSFSIEEGRTIAIVGRSGSGKSTLLHLAAGIDLPSSGRVTVGGHDLARSAERERARIRRDHIGLVFQFFHLVPHLTVWDNIALPAMIAGKARNGYASRIDALLERVGLARRARDTVHHLSGGEMQRIAICRALVRRPSLILADEPTGNLDDANGREVMSLMRGLVADEGATLVYVTHSSELAAMSDETWTLHSGVLEGP